VAEVEVDLRATISVGCVVGVVLVFVDFVPDLAPVDRVPEWEDGSEFEDEDEDEDDGWSAPAVEAESAAECPWSSGERLLPTKASTTISNTTAPTISTEVSLFGRRFMESSA
jgi:hypothetical protein